MTISSRTPEGVPGRCPLCNAALALEFSDPAGDAPCPQCGCLVWKSQLLLDRVRQIHSALLGVAADRITADSDWRLPPIGADSLDAVEMVMAFEDEFDVALPDDAAEQIHTVGDLIRYLESQGVN